MDADKYALLQAIFPLIAIVVAIAVAGWVFNNWLRIKHGYPLDGAWGRDRSPLLPGEAVRWLSFRTAVAAMAVLDRVA